MKTPAAYQARIDHWQTWLDEHPDAKPNQIASVHHVIIALQSVLPAAEAETTRARNVPADPHEFDEWMTGRDGTVHHCGGLLVPAVIDGTSAVHCSECGASGTLVRTSDPSDQGSSTSKTGPRAGGDAAEMSAHPGAVQRECRQGHPRTKMNVRVAPDGRHHCRPCERAAKQRQRA